jgi:hypothetical protein
MLENKRKASLDKMKNPLFKKMNIVKSDFYIGLGNLIVALGEILVAHLGIASVSATAATVGITATTTATTLALPALLPLCMLIFICLNGVIKDKFYADHEKKVTRILTRVHRLAENNDIPTNFCAVVFNGDSKPRLEGEGMTQPEEMKALALQMIRQSLPAVEEMVQQSTKALADHATFRPSLASGHTASEAATPSRAVSQSSRDNQGVCTRAAQNPWTYTASYL